MLEITVKRPGSTYFCISKDLDEFLEWWSREKEIWPNAVIIDIKRA